MSARARGYAEGYVSLLVVGNGEGGWMGCSGIPFVMSVGVERVRGGGPCQSEACVAGQ